MTWQQSDARTMHHSERATASGASEYSLLSEYSEGFHLVQLLREGGTPENSEVLRKQVGLLIERVRKRALAAGIDPTSVEDAGYAVCAAVDEAVLASECGFRDTWEAHPLQLSLFGDQLAGDHFFERLERLRERGRSMLHVLEVFQMCLNLGFRGRFCLQGDERLLYLRARLADEIEQGRQDPRVSSPDGERPDHPSFPLARVVPGTATVVVAIAVSLGAWFMLRLSLERQSEPLASQINTVQLPARVAWLSITLP